MKKTRTSVTLVTVIVMLWSCSPIDTREYEKVQAEAAVDSAVPVMTLGPGDIFEVKVYGEEDLSGVYRVSSQGEITFPLVGKVPVDGLSPSQVESIITQRLGNGYLKEPYVMVFVKEFVSKRITVTGQVNKPGTFQFYPGVNVVDAIALGGGLTDAAMTNQVILTRYSGGREQRFDIPLQAIREGKAPNFALQPGDSVFVPKSML